MARRDLDLMRRLDLGQHDRVESAALSGERLQVGEAGQGRDVVKPHAPQETIGSLARLLQGGEKIGARGILVAKCDPVLEIDDQAIGAAGGCLGNEF